MSDPLPTSLQLLTIATTGIAAAAGGALHRADAEEGDLLGRTANRDEEPVLRLRLWRPLCLLSGAADDDAGATLGLLLLMECRSCCDELNLERSERAADLAEVLLY